MTVYGRLAKKLKSREDQDLLKKLRSMMINRDTPQAFVTTFAEVIEEIQVKVNMSQLGVTANFSEAAKLDKLSRMPNPSWENFRASLESVG
jgi:hypothetical protein